MVFITGSSGLVGSYLLRHLLNQGHEVKALVRTLPDPDNYSKHPKLTYIKVDILYIHILHYAFQDTYYVFHCVVLVSYAV